MKKRQALALFMGLVMVAGVVGCNKPATEEKVENVDAEVVKEDVDFEAPEGYSLVWHDEFDGTELNEEDWNRETHEVGWVNHELQEYIPSDEYDCLLP